MNSADALILIADDNLDIREMLAARFRAAGYRTVEADDGAAALEIVAEQHPNLILMDWVMPTMRGHEVLVQLKADPDTESVPVVMITGRTSQRDRALGILLGADAYIFKPIDFDLLDRTVEQLIEAAHSSAA